MEIKNLGNIINLLKEDLEKVDSELYKHLDSKVIMANEVASYTLKSGGKRIRPILLILSSKLLDYTSNRIYVIASVIEYIHTATLLHDDIIDGAKYRRGRISANNKYGNDIVVLCGDFLYSRAFINLVLDGDSDIQLILANAAKTMSEGEIFQLVKTANFELPIESYLDIIYSKTAVLMSACCEIASIFAKKTHFRPYLKELGKIIGLIFQINDDILDYFGDPSKTGKKTGTDLREGKMTLPLLILREKASKDDINIVKDIFYKDRIFDEDFLAVVRLLSGYKIKEKCYQYVEKYIAKAHNLIKELPDNIYRECLEYLINFAAKREV
ncbi:MAG: polyprenyl synthetase family protein [Deferribacterota bacterium]|nr:polyprenyl synthetase family protein [Deferribacterota bacterium]